MWWWWREGRREQGKGTGRGVREGRRREDRGKRRVREQRNKGKQEGRRQRGGEEGKGSGAGRKKGARRGEGQAGGAEVGQGTGRDARARVMHKDGYCAYLLPQAEYESGIQLGDPSGAVCDDIDYAVPVLLRRSELTAVGDPLGAVKAITGTHWWRSFKVCGVPTRWELLQEAVAGLGRPTWGGRRTYE